MVSVGMDIRSAAVQIKGFKVDSQSSDRGYKPYTVLQRSGMTAARQCNVSENTREISTLNERCIHTVTLRVKSWNTESGDTDRLGEASRYGLRNHHATHYTPLVAQKACLQETSTLLKKL